MKRYLWLLTAAACLAGCKTTKVPISEHSPMAIVTIYGNPSVAWYEDVVTTDYKVERQDEGFLTGLLNKALLRDTSETDTAQDRINDAANQVTSLFKDYGIQVIDPSVLRNAPAYKYAGKMFFDDIANTLPADGYDAISASTKQLNMRMTKATGAKSLAYVKFKFQKVKVKEGLHDIGVAARVHMEIFIADANGKTLLNKEYDEVSQGYTDFYKNAWDRKAVCDLFPRTVSLLLARFADDCLEEGGSITSADDSELTPINIKPKSDDGAEDAGAPSSGEADGAEPNGASGDASTAETSPATEAAN